MADDIYLSPEEQDERAREWFKSNAPALAVGIALGLGAVFGYNKYKDDIQFNAEAASGLYQQTVSEINDSQLANIDEQINALKTDHASTPYAAKAVLIKAQQVAVNDLPAAYQELQWVVDNSDDIGLQHTARIRQAKIKLSLNELDAAKRLASHTPTDSFESHYQEVLGDIALRENDETTARAHFQAAVDALDGQQDNYVQILTIKLNRLPEPAQSSEVQSSEVQSSEADSVEEQTEPNTPPAEDGQSADVQ